MGLYLYALRKPGWWRPGGGAPVHIASPGPYATALPPAARTGQLQLIPVVHDGQHWFAAVRLGACPAHVWVVDGGRPGRDWAARFAPTVTAHAVTRCNSSGAFATLWNIETCSRAADRLLGAGCSPPVVSKAIEEVRPRRPHAGVMLLRVRLLIARGPPRERAYGASISDEPVADKALGGDADLMGYVVGRMRAAFADADADALLRIALWGGHVYERTLCDVLGPAGDLRCIVTDRRAAATAPTGTAIRWGPAEAVEDAGCHAVILTPDGGWAPDANWHRMLRPRGLLVYPPSQKTPVLPDPGHYAGILAAGFRPRRSVIAPITKRYALCWEVTLNGEVRPPLQPDAASAFLLYQMLVRSDDDAVVLYPVSKERVVVPDGNFLVATLYPAMRRVAVVPILDSDAPGGVGAVLQVRREDARRKIVVYAENPDDADWYLQNLNPGGTLPLETRVVAGRASAYWWLAAIEGACDERDSVAVAPRAAAIVTDFARRLGDNVGNLVENWNRLHAQESLLA